MGWIFEGGNRKVLRAFLGHCKEGRQAPDPILLPGFLQFFAGGFGWSSR